MMVIERNNKCDIGISLEKILLSPNASFLFKYNETSQSQGNMISTMYKGTIRNSKIEDSMWTIEYHCSPKNQYKEYKNVNISYAKARHFQSMAFQLILSMQGNILYVNSNQLEME